MPLKGPFKVCKDSAPLPPYFLFYPPSESVNIGTLESLLPSISSLSTLDSSSMKRVSKWLKINETKCASNFKDC